MAEIKIAYAASAALTWSGAIASSSTVGRESNAIDNTSTLYDDIKLSILITFPNSAPANDKTVYILAGGYDSTNGYDGSGQLTGSDAAITLDGAIDSVPHAFKQLGAFWMVQNKTRVFTIGSVASAFGGVLPPKVGFVVINYSGQTLTTFTARYQGITYTVL